MRTEAKGAGVGKVALREERAIQKMPECASAFRRATGQKVACKGAPWREELTNGQDNLPVVYISPRLAPVSQFLNRI